MICSFDIFRLDRADVIADRWFLYDFAEIHGITPTTIKKAVRDLISISKEVAKTEEKMEKDPESMSREELEKLIGQVQKQMKAAAAELNFEMAAELRDKMITLKKSLDDMEE